MTEPPSTLVGSLSVMIRLSPSTSVSLSSTSMTTRRVLVCGRLVVVGHRRVVDRGDRDIEGRDVSESSVPSFALKVKLSDPLKLRSGS